MSQGRPSEPPSESPSEPTVEPDGDQALARALELVALVLGPTTFLSALLYYFGWLRAAATFGHFGVDASLLRFSTQDYLLRSAGIAFRPLAVLALLLLLGVGALLLAGRLTRGGEDRRRVRGLVTVLAVVGASAAVVGFLVLFGVLGPPTRYGGPLALALGVVSLLSAARLGQRTRATRRRGDLSSTHAGVIAVVVALLSVFWGAALYAHDRGVALAEELAAGLDRRPAVVLYAERDLTLSGPGVEAEQLPPGGRYAIRYTGLRLLIRSGPTLVLLPQGWRSPSDRSILLPVDDPGLRFEVAAA